MSCRFSCHQWWVGLLFTRIHLRFAFWLEETVKPKP
jgi:hypothetical protein